MPTVKRERSTSRASSRKSSPKKEKYDPKKELLSLQKEMDKLQKKYTKLQESYDTLKKDNKEDKDQLDFLYEVMEDPKMYREKYKEANDKDIIDILLPDWDKKKETSPVKSKEVLHT